MTSTLRYCALATLSLVVLSLHVLRTPPEGTLGGDLFALGLTCGVLLATLGGIFGVVRLIREAEGEGGLDLADAVPAFSPAFQNPRGVPTAA